MVIEANGIGYKVFTSMSTIEKTSIGEEYMLFTHLHVREDAMTIFGFLSQEELNIFDLLLSVSGVGPKASLSVISCISPSRFGLAVITDDIKTITQAQGIGKKTAQRIILELKDKIKNDELTDIAEQGVEDKPEGGNNSRISEAVSALVVLGYTPLEANKAVVSIYSEDMDIELIIKKALMKLGKN